VVVIGLTGGIASGKSTVSRMLLEMGAAVIDADRVGHEAFRSDSDARREVVTAFGSDVLGQDGEIDRGKLAEIVFEDLEALDQLNRIMHPIIRRMVERQIDEFRSQGSEAVVLEAALLIEAGWTDLVDQVWVVISPESMVVDRLRSQKGYTEAQARARISAQMPSSERSKYADVLIHNDSDIRSLREEVERLWMNTLAGGSGLAQRKSASRMTWTDEIREILAQRQPRFMTGTGRRLSAVLLPIYKKGDDYYIVLTKRSEDMEHHKGQVSFPGGAYEEADGELRNTALREAFEEVGIKPDDVEILGTLDGEVTATSNFTIAPFVGAIPHPYDFKVNTLEVQILIEAPVAALLDPLNFRPQTPDSEGRLHPWGYFRYGEHKITGITARILKQFLDLVFP
jgi:dephospho-CoA kinase